MFFKMRGNDDLDSSLKRLISDNPDLSVIDVGANKGQSLEKFRRLGHRGKYLAIEPVPELALMIEKKFKNKVADLTVISGAVTSSETNTIILNLYPERLELTSLYSLTEKGAADYGITTQSQIEVNTIDINELVHEVKQPVLLKIDTQGADFEILNQLTTESLHKIEAVLVEIPINPIYCGSHDWLDYCSLLHRFDFEPNAIKPVSRNDRNQLIEVDLLAVKRKNTPV